MKIILLILISLIPLTFPSLSHGSKEDCSTECNDYYCSQEIKKNEEKNSSVNNQ